MENQKENPIKGSNDHDESTIPAKDRYPKIGSEGYDVDELVRVLKKAFPITPLEQPADVFISYARSDIKIVKGIYESLMSKNHRPWMDVYSIKAGEDWLKAINNAIDVCEIFLAILSNNSVSRRGVIQKELKKALDKWEGMLPDDIYIIPIRIDDCPIPDLLRHIQVLDWDNGKGESKLLEAIGVGLARRKDE